MARKPRIHYPGAFYHVMVRGIGGQNIFFYDADHSRFYLLLQEGFERYNYRNLHDLSEPEWQRLTPVIKDYIELVAIKLIPIQNKISSSISDLERDC